MPHLPETFLPDIAPRPRMSPRIPSAPAGGSSAPRSLAGTKPGVRLLPWQIARIVRHIEGGLETCIHIEALAALVRLSPSHFTRAFRQSLGVTPHAYLIRCRLERAEEMMIGGRESLCEIAAVCGFADQAHLSRLFRRRCGEAPATWRRSRLAPASAGRLDDVG